MRILLTGATGFVGSHVAELLSAQGYTVFALVRKTSNHESLNKMGVHLLMGSLDHLPDSCPKIDSVIHGAGIIKAKDPNDYFRVNAQGTQNLLEWVKSQPLKSFVLVSSIAARGPDHEVNLDLPVSIYGKSKLKGEHIALQYQKHFPILIFRPPVVYGPGDRETLLLFKMFKWGLFPFLGRKNQAISFVYVEDLANILAASVRVKKTGFGPLYPADGEKGYSMDQVKKIAEEVYQKKMCSFLVPLWILKLGAMANILVSAFTPVTPFLTFDKLREISKKNWVCSSKDCRTFLNLPPFTDLKTGFAKTKKWYEAKGWI